MPLTAATKEFIEQSLSSVRMSILDMTVDEFREMQRGINDSLSGPIPKPVKSYEEMIGDSHVNIHRPDNFKLGMPTLLYVPGGAFVTSGFKNVAPLRMARDCQVIVIDHRLAPENPFPASIDDVEKAITTIWGCRKRLELLEDSLFIGGDSSGANFAIVALLRMRDKNSSVPFKRGLFISPAIDLSMSPKSLAEYDKEDKLFGDDVVTAVQNWYAPNLDLRHPEISPLYNTEGFVGFPSGTIIIPEYDRLRSQAEAFKQVLRRSNVDVEEHICLGEIHAALNLRAALHEGEDPAEVVAKTIHSICQPGKLR